MRAQLDATKSKLDWVVEESLKLEASGCHAIAEEELDRLQHLFGTELEA